MTRTRMTRRAAAEGGIALLAVVFLVMLLAGLSFGLIEEGMAARTSVRHHESNLQALEILEAGIVRSVQEIRAQHAGYFAPKRPAAAPGAP